MPSQQTPQLRVLKTLRMVVRGKKEQWMGDLGNNVVSGGVMGDEACQDDDGRVLQACVCLLDRTHQGLQIRVLLQQHPTSILLYSLKLFMHPKILNFDFAIPHYDVIRCITV